MYPVNIQTHDHFVLMAPLFQQIKQVYKILGSEHTSVGGHGLEQYSESNCGGG